MLFWNKNKKMDSQNQGAKSGFAPMFKRAYSSSSHMAASMTVEACIAMPIFIFAMMTLIYIIQIINVQTKLQGVIHDYSVQAAKYSSIYELNQYDLDMHIGDEENRNFMYRMLGNGIGAVTAKTIILSWLPDDFTKNANIEGEDFGLHLYHSSFLDGDEFVDIVLTYKINFPFGLLGDNGYEFTQRARVKTFACINDTSAIEREEIEDVVYITYTGKVYHTNRYCTYIKIDVTKVNKETIPTLRNESGGKYYECERCKKHNGLEVFITKYGDRFHTDINCSSLKRGVLEIPLSEAKDRRLCSKCAGK